MSSLAEILAPDGLLAAGSDRWEHRPQQIAMAQAVEHALSARRPLVVEAATGTGKSLAYLIPALRSGKRVIISTASKALQEQLFSKDIPFVAQRWPEPFEAVLLKGRTNYLCKLRWEGMRAEPTFRSREDAAIWPRVKAWAASTETGDRAEVEGMPDDWATWRDLSVATDACLGAKCPFHDVCFVTKARREAETARLVVVNHHLFFADLAVRDAGFGEILPAYDAVVFDEAHHLEATATSYFGIQISNFRFRELISDLERTLDQEEINAPGLEDALVAVDKAHKTFFSNLTFGLYDGRAELGPHWAGGGEKLAGESLRVLTQELRELARQIHSCSELGELADKLENRAVELRLELGAVMRADDERYVYFLEVRDRGVFLQASPIDVADLLRRKLLETHDTLVFTSATLATGGSLEFFRRRIGMQDVVDTDGIARDPIDVDELVLPPVFDYERQCLVYVPNRLPPPTAPDYCEHVATVVEYLVGQSRGRAFVLFTSYSNLDTVYELVAPKLDYLCLRQGEAPRSELLQRFRDDGSAVLFATSSFWEGVDVEGEALSLVIIDKLPFASPGDPITRARLALVESRGGNSFMDYSVPAAALSLKQGFGRLIRSERDEGVVAILDSRIATKRYGRHFLESLPPAPVVWRAAAVRDWFAAR